MSLIVSDFVNTCWNGLHPEAIEFKPKATVYNLLVNKSLYVDSAHFIFVGNDIDFGVRPLSGQRHGEVLSYAIGITQ